MSRDLRLSLGLIAATVVVLMAFVILIFALGDEDKIGVPGIIVGVGLLVSGAIGGCRLKKREPSPSPLVWLTLGVFIGLGFLMLLFGYIFAVDW